MKLKSIIILITILAVSVTFSCCKNTDDSEQSYVFPSPAVSESSEPEPPVSSVPVPSVTSEPETVSADNTPSTVSAAAPDSSHNHSYTERVIAPTCTAKGYTLHTCSCGSTFKDNYTALKAHSWSKWSVTKKPTTQAKGEERRTCSVCKQSQTREIPKLESQSIGEMEQQVLDIVNRHRRENGLPELAYRSDAQAAANLRADEIITLFSHTRPDGTQCFTALGKLSFRTAGENIAEGYATPDEVMKGWMNSPGHRENILKKEFTGLAVGIAEKSGRYYWVQLFLG